MNSNNIQVVLVNPSHPGNIGAVARAMKNMGLRKLVLVDPRKFPDPEAQWRSASAVDIIDSARVVSSLDEAIKDSQFVVGTSARDRRIRVSDRTNLAECLIGTGTPFLGHCDEQMEWYLKGLGQIAGNSMGIRRMGAAALDLAYVAAGRLDGFWEAGLKPWDIAAGALLIRESGGLVTNFKGSDDVLDGGDIMTANPKLLKQIAASIR